MCVHIKSTKAAGILWYMHMTDDQKVAELEQAVNALMWARHNGLELEWHDCYMEHRSQGYTTTEAIQHANREWDL